MKTKVVYVLVSSPKDIYLEQAYVSIASLRHHMGSDVNINILTDKITYSLLDDARKKMLDQVDDLVVVDLPTSFSAQNRSRILKTSCRQHIDGDFLFIDCDTVITKRLDSIDEIQADIAACHDSHSKFKDNPYRDLILKDCKRIGIDISNEKDYFNSGVIFVKDSPKAHTFFELWNKFWLEGRSKGVNVDQPTFAKSNLVLGNIIKPLNDVWNCEIIHGIRYLRDAKILHYLCTNSNQKNKSQEVFILKELKTLMQIKSSKQIPLEISVCFDDPFKGIPSLTSILAGNHNKVVRCACYQYLIDNINSKSYRLINCIFVFLRKINSATKRMIRR